jgi:hypothetical protein
MANFAARKPSGAQRACHLDCEVPYGRGSAEGPQKPWDKFVRSDWRIMVQNLELPYNVKLKAQVVTDRVPSDFKCDSCWSSNHFSNMQVTKVMNNVFTCIRME